MKARILIGPNGSGKSTLYSILKKEYKMSFGYFINADEILKEVSKHHSLNVNKALSIDEKSFKTFLTHTTLNKKFNFKNHLNEFEIIDNIIKVKDKKIINSYTTAVIADYLRSEAMKQKINFSFETVFSDKSKIDFVKQLKQAGYEVYVYFVSTMNVAINIDRVKHRVLSNGHGVPEEKIISRFDKSVANAKQIIKLSKRFYIIDNSQDINPTLIKEIENGSKTVYTNKTYYPVWVNNFK